VEKVMGMPGEALKDVVEEQGVMPSSNVPIPSNAFDWYSSDNVSDRIGVSVLFARDDGRVLSKHFIGIAVSLMPQDARTTKEKFSEIEKRMTYDEAVSSLGMDGFLVNASATYIGRVSIFEQYAWWQNDNPTSIMKIMFQNGEAVVVDKVN
jgi:hypothetical protein